MPNIADEVIALAERKSKKAAQLASLLRDPDLADIVNRLTGNGNGAIPRPSSSSRVPAVAGGVREAVRKLYPMLPERFTSTDVFELLAQESYEFKSSDPMSSIRDALFALCHKLKEVKIVTEGKGGQPNVYQLVIR